MVNSVTIVGRVGQDPEIKYFESGSNKAVFSVAVDRGFSKENRETDWFRVEAWGRQAEFVGEWIKKGRLISVMGQIDVQRWNDPAGNLREMCIIKATNVGFVGSKQESAPIPSYQ